MYYLRGIGDADIKARQAVLASSRPQMYFPPAPGQAQSELAGLVISAVCERGQQLQGAGGEGAAGGSVEADSGAVQQA